MQPLACYTRTMFTYFTELLSLHNLAKNSRVGWLVLCRCDWRCVHRPSQYQLWQTGWQQLCQRTNGIYCHVVWFCAKMSCLWDFYFNSCTVYIII